MDIGDTIEPDEPAPAPVPVARVEITIEAIDAYYYATSHRSVVRRIVVRNIDLPADGPDIVVTVQVDSAAGAPPLRPFSLSIPSFAPGDLKIVSGVRLTPNHQVLSRIDELLAGDVRVTARVGDEVVGEATQPISFLAFNQWMHRREYFDSLAAFVQPHAVGLRPVLIRTRDLLGERTGWDGTGSYGRAADVSRIAQVAEAVFDALRELGLSYTTPPASFEGYGQKVRTPDVALADGAATCLDSSVLVAACLQALGIDAHILIVTGHALVLYDTGHRPHTVEAGTIARVLDRSVADNANDIAVLVRAGVLAPIETTLITDRGTEATFASASERPSRYFTTDGAEIDALVNVAYARRHGVPALPSEGVLASPGADDAEEVTPIPWLIDRPAEDAPGVVDRSAHDAGRDHDEADAGGSERPPRVNTWLRSLLDLTYANPLLRLGGNSGTNRVHRIELPDGLLSALEDRLMATGTFGIVPATRAPSGLLRDPTDVAGHASELHDSGRVYWPSLVTYEAELAAAEQALEEHDPDLTPSDRATRAAAELEAHYQRALERSLTGLRRRAREIESQTGANTLFLTIGTMTWKETTSGRGRANVQTGRAPLLLIPVRITGRASTGLRVECADADEAIPNHCLLEKLRQTFGITIPELEHPVADASGVDVDRLISSIRATLGEAEARDIIVTEDAHLAVLSFSTFRLWKDMRDHWETFLENPVVAHLVERPNESFDEPEPPTESRLDRLRCPIVSDRSQLRAVQWSVEGRSFVIEGPPGTGKSQTIANLLAANIAEGKKVLFVAEKQAALDVVKRRLDQVGLGPFCLDLHDKGSKAERIREQIRASLDFAPIDRQSEWDELEARWDADIATLGHYRDALHETGASGLSAWTARQEELAIGDGAAFDVPIRFTASAPAQIAEVRAALLDLPRLVRADVLRKDGPWALCRRDDFEAIDRVRLAEAIDALAANLTAFAHQPLHFHEAIAAVTDPSSLSTVATTLDLWTAGQLLTDEECDQVLAPDWIATRDRALRHIRSIGEGHAAVLTTFSPAIYRADLPSLITAAHAATAASMFQRNRRRQTLDAMLTPYVTGLPPAPGLALSLLQHAAAGLAELDEARSVAGAIPGVRLDPAWSPLEPDAIAELTEHLDLLPERARLLRTNAASAARAAMASGWTPDRAALDAIASAAGWWQQLLELFGADDDACAAWLDGRSFLGAWDRAQAAWSDASPRFLDLQRWCEARAALRPLIAAGMSDIAHALLDGQVPVDDAYDRFRRGFVATAFDERAEAGRIDLFDGRAHDARVQRFIDHDTGRRELIHDLIPAKVVGERPVAKGRRVGRWGALEQELERRSRRLSIRKLVSDYAEILPDLAPCFLMSPDSVARFVEPGSMTFDLVVFDEASQIEVAKAIGAMGRARAVVVVGDTRQMPPTRFAGTAANVDPDDVDDADDELLYEDLESILSECVESNLPRLYLECHYRSRHEALIAFSNRSFYDGRLTTFPSPAGPEDVPLSWRRLDGRFDRRSRGDALRTNRVEAEAIVAEVLARIHDPIHAAESIGIVTLNAPQQQLIGRLLEETGDERVRTLLDDDSDQGLIVRNLESVQGDERDVVLLSVGFSPVTTTDEAGNETRGRLPLNFGPLNKRGGERRLNVAVTRARAEMVVFCSFDPEEMHLGDNAAVGLQRMREFLEIVRDGPGRSADLVGRAPTAPDRHRHEIAEAIRARGLRVREDVGLSSFRVDLAVGSDGQDWPVAVLLDGPTWAERGTAYDRDGLPTVVLRDAMGWQTVLRVWLPMWLHARDEVLDDIAAAVASPPDRSALLATVPSASSELTVRLEPTDADDVDASTGVDANTGDSEADDAADDGPDADGDGDDGTAELEPLGTPDVLDRLDSQAARDLVTRAIMECLEHEAPLEATELARRVADRFGVKRLTEGRRQAILGLVPNRLLHLDSFGDFVWRDDLVPERWTDYRPVESGGRARPLDQVSPEELTNALVDLVRQGVSIELDELVRLGAATFGVRRVTAAVRARVEAVLTWAVELGRLDRSHDTFRLPPR